MLPRWSWREKVRGRAALSTVGFHNFNLRIFNSRVSNPSKLIVDVFLTRCRISMCQGLGPKKHDEILEIGCTVGPFCDRWGRTTISMGTSERFQWAVL